MAKIVYKSKVKYKGKTTNRYATLLDSGAESCYIDEDIAQIIGVKNLKKDYVGLGYTRIRYGPFYCSFIVTFKNKTYRATGKTYVTNLIDDVFDIVLSGNWIQKAGIPVHKIIKRDKMYEY